MIHPVRKTTLELNDSRNDMVELKIELDVTELTAREYLKKIVDLMTFQGYHDVAIHEALKDVADDLEEYLQSVVDTKPHWETKYENNKDSQEDGVA